MRKSHLKLAGTVIFILYLCVLIYFLFFADRYGRAPRPDAAYHYNLTPLREIKRFATAGTKLPARDIFLNIFGNILVFMPFGFFFPIVAGLKRTWLAIPAGAALSLSVEIIQLTARVGRFDVDDILLNTLGAAIGCALCPAAKKLVGSFLEK